MIGSIVAIISDTHTGGSTAIAPPKFTTHTGRKDETTTNTYNRIQEWLYACWMDFWEYTYHLAGIVGNTRKRRLIVIHLGDVIDGKHHNSVQVMEELGDQLDAACNLLRPVRNKADEMYLTYGTPAHNGGAAESEGMIGDELAIHHDWTYSLDIDGVVFDLAHHGWASRLGWTSSGAKLATAVASDYALEGKPRPRYVLRGHNHVIDDSGDKVPGTRAISLPSWQLRTAFGWRVASNSKRSEIGGLIINTEFPDFPIMAKMRYTAPGGFIKTEKV